MKIAVLITNYNMPERCDTLCDHIERNVSWPHDLIVVDNGSDLVPPSKYTKVFLNRNIQTTGGWLAGLEYAKKGDFFCYWFLITSAEFPEIEKDPLERMANWILENPKAVGVHPALTTDSTTYWEHLKTRGGDHTRRTWMIDNIASLWRANWFEKVGQFDRKLKYGWGIDLELCWKARKQNRSLWVHEGVKIKKITDIGYSMNRMNMSAGKKEKSCQKEYEKSSLVVVWSRLVELFDK